MKSLDDLKRLRDEAKKAIENRDSDKDYRIVVGMATCGIAAGARPVMEALLEEQAKGDYSCVIVQTGCIGMCVYEPIVEVYDKSGNKTTYIKMTALKAVRVMQEHIKKGQIVEEYTINSVKR